LAFATEPDFDWVYLYNGRTQNPQQLIASLTGRNESIFDQNFTSTTNEMLLAFYTNNQISDVDIGWKATFRTVYPSTNPSPTTTITTTMAPTTTWSNPNICQTPNTFYGSGTIQSPGFPFEYGNNLNCTQFLISNPSGNRMQLRFDAFVTEQCCDLVFLYDGYTIQSPLIKRLSGRPPLNDTYTTVTSDAMLVQFVTDPTTVMSGWKATFNSVGAGTVATTIPTPRPSITGPDERCQPGWVHDSTYPLCFLLVTSGATWNDAVTACGNFGGQLASVRSRVQNDFIANNVISDQMGGNVYYTWLGLNNQGGGLVRRHYHELQSRLVAK